ncbi:response regulator [Sulfuricurvum sp.]|uniref:response regulator n=1 Tax=Sulfuricurvum sp. TaxID=2025608 RepID=UPI0035666781
MGRLKLLIVDDVEDNRLVLKAICRKMEGFDIKEACDGVEAVEITDEWHPHIILMDVMMPRMDGFQAAKIIKEAHPQTLIMVVTAVIDPHMEENMASIGVAAYIHKPIDKELIRFKLESFGALIRSKKGKFKKLSEKEALNPFNADIRHFKTIFDIDDAEGMMDFGMWVLGRCEEKTTLSCTKIDAALGLFYELMRHGTRDGQSLSIIIEESFEEMYVTMKFEESMELKSKAMALLNELGAACIVRENIVCVRLGMHHENSVELPQTVAVSPVRPVEISLKSAEPTPSPLVANEPEAAREVRVIHSNEQQMLRQSFVHKTTAAEYIREIGGDVLDEIRDLASLDEEWKEKLGALEDEPSAQNLRNFIDGVLGVYVGAINNLFEFTALAYALSSLGSFLKENADMIIGDPKKLKTLIMLMEHLGTDLASWRDHIFGLQDAGDIHYLDSSFFSSCMQIEGIIGDKVMEAEDDDDGMEFF